MPQGVGDELVEACKRRRALVLFAEVAKLARVALPDLARPKDPSVLQVLEIVADDVGLLQEEAHRVGQLLVFPDRRRLQAGLRKQVREADADQPGDVVAVAVPLRRRVHALALEELGHAGPHAPRNVGDRRLVRRLEA